MGNRKSEPESTATAASQANCMAVSWSSTLIATASTPSINQTAKSSVKATVDSARTRFAAASDLLPDLYTYDRVASARFQAAERPRKFLFAGRCRKEMSEIQPGNTGLGQNLCSPCLT
jgi:hypothetical protein